MPLPGNPLLALLRTQDPAAWARQIRAALEEHEAIGPAAVSLGIGRVTLWRWVRDTPSLGEGLDLDGPGNPGWTSRKP